MQTLLLIALTLIAASFGTMTGFGTSTVMIPVLLLFFAAPETLLFVGIIHWFGDIWKMIFFKKGINLKLILWFGIPGIIVSFLAAKVPITLSENILQRFLGGFLIAYILFLFIKPKWKIKASSGSAFVGGGLSGLFAGIFGVGGAVRTIFLTPFNLEKSVFLFTSGAIGILIDSARISQYLLSGVGFNQNLIFSLTLCIPASFLAAFIGKKLVDKIPQKAFRVFIAAALLLASIKYLLGI